MTNKVDKALRQAVAMYLGCTRLVKLWENASPASLFPAQTVSMDLSRYDAVAVVFRTDYKFEYTFTEFCLIGETGIASVTRNTAASSPLVGNVGANVRSYAVAGDGIAFGVGIFSHSSDYNGNNEGCIPLRIYGMKLSGGAAPN